MIIDCISDLHGHYPKLEGGDLLIIGGDLTARDTFGQLAFDFITWLSNQQYTQKIVIAGNHDGILSKDGISDLFRDFGIYLLDSGTEFQGLKIWGSPWTPTFLKWHFMLDRGAQIKAKWDLIPDDINILITHGPPYSILDSASTEDENSNKVGCMDLMDTIPRLKNLKLHVFGHIHEAYGHEVINGTHFVNASYVDENYIPGNKPIRIEL